MRIEGAMPRRRRLSMTPLIDVIFLLLLFFMLSSTFTRFSEIDINAGRAGEKVHGNQKPDIIIVIEAEETWTVNGLVLPEIAAIAELVRLEEAGAATAFLVVREAVSSQVLVDRLRILGDRLTLQITVAG